MVEICLKMQEKDRLDFISMFQTILFSDKAKMKYLLFVQENSLQDLESMNWTIEPNNENIITVLPKFQENIVEKIAIKENLEDPLLQKYSGIMQNLSITDLCDGGFKIGWQQPYSYQNKFDELLQFQKKQYVIVGAREKGKNMLLLAAMGEGKKVFQETKDIKEAHLHNKVFWYFMRKKSFGFSDNEKVYLDEIDIVESIEKRDFEKGKLSWCLTGNFGGWRIGDFIDLDESTDYDKIILYKD